MAYLKGHVLRGIWEVTCLFACGLSASTAFAQNTAQSPPDIVPPSDESNVPSGHPQPAENGVPGEHAQKGRAPLADVAASLKDAGITPQLFMWDIYANNVSVGPRQGKSSLSTNIAVGADFDMDKIVGIPGGTFHAQYIFFPANHNVDATTPSGEYFGAAGGFYAGLQQSDISKGYLSKFAYGQKLFNNTLDLTVGRFSAGVEFYHKGTLDCMIKVDCADPVWEKSSGTLPPPYGSWAAMARLNLKKHVYAKAGIFQLDLNQYLNKGNGFNWSFNSSIANNVSVEIGYETSDADSRYPAHYWATLFRNTYDLTSDDGSGDHVGGTTGFMLNGRKTVWRADDAGVTSSLLPKSIVLFGSYSALVDPDAVMSLQQRPFKRSAEIGTTYIGMFGRPMDMFSIALSMGQLSDRYYDFIKQRVPDAKQTTVAIRTKYDISLPLGFVIEPGISYIFNPDDTANGYGIFRPSATRQLHDGLMFRFMIAWNVGQALGL